MALKISKTIQLTQTEMIRYQLIHYCFMKNIRLNNTQINCLTLLGELGTTPLRKFCQLAADQKILANSTAVQNCLYQMDGKGVYVKKKQDRLVVFLDPSLNILTEGSILIELKLITIGTNSGKGAVQKNSTETQLA